MPALGRLRFPRLLAAGIPTLLLSELLSPPEGSRQLPALLDYASSSRHGFLRRPGFPDVGGMTAQLALP